MLLSTVGFGLELTWWETIGFYTYMLLPTVATILFCVVVGVLIKKRKLVKSNRAILVISTALLSFMTFVLLINIGVLDSPIDDDTPQLSEGFSKDYQGLDTAKLDFVPYVPSYFPSVLKGYHIESASLDVEEVESSTSLKTAIISYYEYDSKKDIVTSNVYVEQHKSSFSKYWQDNCLNVVSSAKALVKCEQLEQGVARLMSNRYFIEKDNVIIVLTDDTFDETTTKSRLTTDQLIQLLTGMKPYER